MFGYINGNSENVNVWSCEDTVLKFLSLDQFVYMLCILCILKYVYISSSSIYIPALYKSLFFMFYLYIKYGVKLNNKY